MRPKAKVAARGITNVKTFLAKFPRKYPSGLLSLVTPFRHNVYAENASHLHIEISCEQAYDMLEPWSDAEIVMSDRIVIYRLEPHSYHLTFEGMEAIPV